MNWHWIAHCIILVWTTRRWLCHRIWSGISTFERLACLPCRVVPCRSCWLDIKIIDSSVLWNWLVISPNGGSTMIVVGTKGLTFSRESLFLKERLRVFLLECITTIITTLKDGIAVRRMRNSNLNSRTVIVTKKAESLQQKEFRAHQPLSCYRGWHHWLRCCSRLFRCCSRLFAANDDGSSGSFFLLQQQK